MYYEPTVCFQYFEVHINMYFEPTVFSHLNIRLVIIFISRFLISEWNVNHRIWEKLPRSNCALESLHRTIYKTIGHANPTIWELIERIQNEETSARLKISETERGDTPKQNKVYKDLTERLENLVHRYENMKESHQRMKFLEKVSLSLKTVEVIPDDDKSFDEKFESEEF